MPLRSLLRDLVLIGAAAATGWWVRNSNDTVLAQRSGSSSSSRGSSSGADATLAFQFNGVGPQSSLAIYSPAYKTIFVYPRVGEGNSSVDCGYSFTVVDPGGPIRRQNCPVGELVPQR